MATAAGLATLQVLEETNPYAKLERLATQLADGLTDAARAAGVPLQVSRAGSALTPFFAGAMPTDYTSAMSASRERYAAYFRSMLERGVYLPPSQFEAAFVSAAHSDEDIDRTIEAARAALEEPS